jgi:hypothetical protein
MAQDTKAPLSHNRATGAQSVSSTAMNGQMLMQPVMGRQGMTAGPKEPDAAPKK